MRLNFSGTSLNPKAFSKRPMMFCEPSSKIPLSAICDIIAVETGSREARDAWQAIQLRNLCSHAAARSDFWRRRIGPKLKDIKLSSLPILTREELIEQVDSEGCLLTATDGLDAKKHATSGSTGTPTHFFVSSMNTEYNNLRSLAQYFIEGRDLSRNKTLLQHTPSIPRRSLRTELTKTWATPLDGLFQSGKLKIIQYFHPSIADLRSELARHEIGYLLSSPRIMEPLLHGGDATFLKRSGMICWLPVGEFVDPATVCKLMLQGVAVRSSYSAEEVGVIATECEFVRGAYHVATSNVIVEVDYSDSVTVGGQTLGRVLISHIHSYATPMLRYDVGDFASYRNRCDCGHDGPVVSNIYGRSKSLLKHGDGRLSPFNVRDNEIAAIIDCQEYRIRQIGIGRLVVELATEAAPTEAQADALTRLLRMHADEDLDVQIVSCKRIDWGRNRKRLGFLSEVL